MNTTTKEQREEIYNRASELIKTTDHDAAVLILTRDYSISGERAKRAIWHAEAKNRGEKVAASHGRPPTTDEKFIQTAFWLPGDMISWLKSRPGKTMSEAARDAIRKAMDETENSTTGNL